jgi:hypothetical protein
MIKKKVQFILSRLLAASSQISIAIILLGIFSVVNYIGEKYTNTSNEAYSATLYDFHGHVWSDTIGWISLNCMEGGLDAGNNIIDRCLISNYKVKTDASRNVSGYGWSDAVGWISFQETTGCPSAPCQIELNSGGLTGWARVMSAAQPSDPNPDRGGWDGWIQLDSSSPVYKVSRSVDDLIGHAWGDINLGWLSFNCLQGGLDGGNNIISRCPLSNYKAYLEPITIPDPTLTFTVPTNAILGQSKTLTWSTTALNTCTASGSWTGAKAMPSGTESTITFSTQGSYTYNLNCLNTTYNIPIAATRVITVSDGICNGAETMAGGAFDCTSVVSNFTANPKIVKENKPTTLKWNIIGGQSCKLYSPTNVLLGDIPNGNNIGSTTTVPITGKQTYSIKCLGGVESTATVSVYLLFEY